MLLMLAFFMQSMFFGAGDMLTNVVANSAMLLVPIAVGVALRFFLCALHALTAFGTLCGIIVERDNDRFSI